MRFGDLKNWVSGGISAVMIFALCITSAFNDLNLQKGRKKSFLPLFLTMILPIILLLLLESYLDIGWIGIALYAGIAVFLFGVVWTPQLLNPVSYTHLDVYKRQAIICRLTFEV